MKTITTDDDHLLPSELELSPPTLKQKIGLNDICLDFARRLSREVPLARDLDPFNSPLPRIRG